MANSCSKITLGCEPWDQSPRTCGPLGWNDAGSPYSSLLGDTPGALGVNDHAEPYLPLVLTREGIMEWILERGKELTKDCEGNRGNPYWPKGASGITIGYGYDMKERSQASITNDLKDSGVPLDLATLLSSGAHISTQTTPNAAAFLISSVTFRGVKKLYQDLAIDQPARDKLFEIVYDFYDGEVARICRKPDVVAKYGACDWPNLHPAIKAVLIDLRFRGDYHTESREYIQKSVAQNNPKAFADSLQLFLDDHDDVYESGIVTRFEKRINFARQYGGICVT